MVKTLSHEQPWCTLTACNFAPDLHIHVFFYLTNWAAHICVINCHQATFLLSVLYYLQWWYETAANAKSLSSCYMGIPSAYMYFSNFTSHLRRQVRPGKHVIFINVGAHNQIIKSIPVGRFCEYSHSNSFQFYCWTRNSMSKYAKRCMAGWCPAYACNAQRQNQAQNWHMFSWTMNHFYCFSFSS